jgi:hypothetical protein
MGTITKSIGTTGRDYSTLQAWEDALPANLVTDGNAQVGECYNDSEFSGTLVVAGETTDSTNSITLKCAAGQSFRDHGSVQTNALRYNQSVGVGITVTATYTIAISVAVNNITFDGLQVRTTGASGDCPAIAITGTVDFVRVQNCICDTTSSVKVVSLYSNSASPTASYIRNSLLIQRLSAQPALMAGNGSGVYYCTIVKPSNITPGGTAITSTYADPTITNTAIFGFTTLESGGATGNNNCSDLAIGFGTSNQASKTYANQFVATDASAGAHDFKIKTGADCVDTGATDSTNGANDIAKTARPSGSAYDIGCWELVQAAAASWFKKTRRFTGGFQDMTGGFDA